LPAIRALAQKHGGILKLYSWDSPPSVSILDGPNPIGQRTIAPVFNNLIMFDQHVKQTSLSRPVVSEEDRPARRVRDDGADP
jgi:hypothetical protein